jgi:hypothetical protein
MTEYFNWLHRVANLTEILSEWVARFDKVGNPVPILNRPFERRSQ